MVFSAEVLHFLDEDSRDNEVLAKIMCEGSDEEFEEIIMRKILMKSQN